MPASFLEFVKSPSLEPFKDQCVSSFCLPVAAWMSDGDKAQPDPELLTVLSERGAGELGVVISNDMVGNPKAAHNSYEEFDRRIRGDPGRRARLQSTW